jgi:hypothetical protein
MGPMAAVALHALWEASAVAGSFHHLCGRFMKSIVTNTSENSTCRRPPLFEGHEGHTIYVKPGEERFLIPEVIAAFSMTAPRDRIIERIRELEAAGLDEIAFCFPNDGAPKESRS